MPAVAAAAHMIGGMNVDTNLGHALRDRRERLGVTRVAFAQLAGCGISTLGSIEQGAVPRYRSEVYDRAIAALDRLEAQGEGVA